MNQNYLTQTENIEQNLNQGYICPTLILKSILEQLNHNLGINITYSNLKTIIQKTNVNLTQEEIHTYLEQEKQKTIGKYNNPPLEEIIVKKIEEASAISQEHLNYYKKYIEIVKQKILLILNIVEEIINNDLNNETILSLDLNLDNGQISLEDADRITKALYENIIDLLGLKNKANDLDTYKETYRYKHNKTIPTLDLQNKDLSSSSPRGYIRLSKKQYNELCNQSIIKYQKKLKFEVN